jgi:hypothetical protein
MFVSVRFAHLLVILIGFLTSVGASAQEKQTVQPQQYIYEVRGSSTSAPAQDRSWSQIYDTEGAAMDQLRKIEQDYAKGGLLELVQDKPVRLRIEKFAKSVSGIAKDLKDAKAAVDKAKKIAEDGLTAEERKLGDTLKEFANQIRDSYQKATKAKNTVISIVGTVARSKFEEANRLIDNYNRTRSEFAQTSRAAVGSSLFPRFAATLTQYPELARVTPQELKGILESDAQIPSGKFTVWVYNQVGGQWVKQDGRTLSTNALTAGMRILPPRTSRVPTTSSSPVDMIRPPLSRCDDQRCQSDSAYTGEILFRRASSRTSAIALARSPSPFAFHLSRPVFPAPPEESV